MSIKLKAEKRGGEVMRSTAERFNKKHIRLQVKSDALNAEELFVDKR